MGAFHERCSILGRGCLYLWGGALNTSTHTSILKAGRAGQQDCCKHQGTYRDSHTSPRPCKAGAKECLWEASHDGQRCPWPRTTGRPGWAVIGPKAGAKPPAPGSPSLHTSSGCCGFHMSSGQWSSWRPGGCQQDGAPGPHNVRTPGRRAGLCGGSPPSPGLLWEPPMPSPWTEAGQLGSEGQHLEKEGAAGRVRGDSSWE